jgi:hypothetical protein
MQTFMFGRERLVKVSLLPEGDIGQKDKRECWPPTLKALCYTLYVMSEFCVIVKHLIHY